MATIQETQKPESEVAVEEAIPSSEEQPVENNDPMYAEVLNGEGPRQFAERNGISLDSLMQLNGFEENYGVVPGQSLRIK